MLSISPLAGGGQGYYLQLANINYYLEGGEPEGRWFGRGCAEFGLSGTVEREHLERLCNGFHHEEPGRKLVQNAGVFEGPKARKPGDDLCFSADKTISAIFAVADDDLRQQIRRAQDRAVEAALEAVQEYAGIARCGRDGQRYTAAPLLSAKFPHSTSRAEEPQLHTHTLLLNLTRLEDGKTRTIDSTHAYHWKMALGSLYRAEMARQMQRLGFEVARVDEGNSSYAQVVGVPEPLLELWSTRRAEVEETLLEKVGTVDGASARSKEIAALDTRRKKTLEKPFAELVAGWREDARAFGFTPESIEQLRSPDRTPSLEDLEQRKDEVWEEALGQLTYFEAHWAEKDMVRVVADRAQGRLSSDEVRELVTHKIRSQELLVRGHLVTREKNLAAHQYVDRVESRYTTPLIMAQERRLLETVERLNREAHHAVDPAVRDRVLARYPTIDPEQRRAVEQLTSGGPIRMLSGTAGTGKSFTLTACREIFEAEGRQVLGIADAGRTAQRLEQDTGIASQTMARTLLQLRHGRLKLTERSTLVVDEAGMLGSVAFAKILEYVEESKARILFVGDSWQLQPVTAGAPYKVLGNLVEAGAEATLNRIRRQEQQWARDAVLDLKAGKSADALAKFIENKQFTVTETRREAMGEVVARLELTGGVAHPERSVMIAGTNGEVAELNRLAQAVRIRAGLVDPGRKLKADAVFLHVGDQLVFRSPSRRYGLLNGDSGTVLAVDPERQTLAVRLDRDGREVTVNLSPTAKRYAAKHCRLAYAQTSHLMQGATVNHASILLGGPTTDLHQGYVQGSRARKCTHLVINAEDAGPDLKDIIRTLGRERQKRMAHELFAPAKVAPRVPDPPRVEPPAPEPARPPHHGPTLSP
jgi:conjugative relaxase-like TrwC/TraI family protein